MGKKPSDIGNFEESKIIIMDNPFAKTNAEHLLEPMFDIATKYKIQLICFSGIGGSAVYNRFDVIYVAKVLADNFRNKENVEFSKNEDTLETYDFEFYTEQTSLI
jgi:glucose-6-phosphate isomerase